MQSNNPLTWRHIKENEGVLINSKIIVQKEFIGDTIAVYKREYYKKRNGKTCNVDYPSKKFKTDWTRIKKYKTFKTYSTGENDWRPLHTSNTYYKLNDDYKEELINLFKNKI